MRKRRTGKLAARLCVLMSLLLIIAMPVSSLANATVTYENDIPVKIVLNGFDYEAPPASWKLSGSELNTSNLQKVAQHVISDWAPLAYQIFRWGRNEGGDYSGITANIPNGKSWDTYFSESESESWKIILSDWLAASDAKTKGSTQNDYSHRTGIMSTTSLSGLRNAMAEEIRKGLGASHFTVAEVLEEGGGGDKGALHELNDTRNTKAFYNIVTHLNNSSGSIYYYNSYGIAVYDFEMTPIVDPNLEYRDQKQTVDPNGTRKDAEISYTENKSRQESNVSVEVWDQTSQTVENSITKTESVSLTETIHNEFNFGSDNMFFKDSLQIEFSATQTIETAMENREALQKEKGGKVTISHNLPPQTGSVVELETRDMTTNTTYTCPVALRYKVAIFSMSGYSSANYIKGTRSNFSTVFGFGNDEGGHGAPENLNLRAVAGNNNNHISNDASYGKVHGWYEDKEICNYLDWSWILNRSGMTSLTKKLGTTIPLFGQGASLNVVTEGKYTTIGEVLPLYPLKEVRLERGEEYYELVVGNSLNVKNLDVEGYNENGVAYFGFDSSKGSWVLSDASGKELNSSSVAKLESSASRITLKALSPGIVYLKYKIDEKSYNTLSTPETYTKNSNLKKTAMVEIEVVPVPVNGVSLDDTDLELTVGESAALKATVTPNNAANKNVTWSSNKPSIAKVDQDGKVTAVAAGTAKITVTTQDGRKTAVCVVTVNAKTYTVTFVDGQGKTFASRTVKEGDAAVAPSNPKRTGYTFKGWDKDFEYITADTVITAQWEKNTEPTQPGDPTDPTKADDQKTDPTKADDQKTDPTKADDQKTDPTKADDQKMDPTKADDQKTDPTKAAEQTKPETAVTVEEKVKEISVVNKLTTEDATKVKEAYQAYKSLSKEEKAELPSGTSTKIDKARKQIDKIQKAEAADKNSVKNRQAEITSRKSDADLAKSTYAPLKVKAGTTTDTSVTVSWSKVKGATGYIVYGNLSGKSYKMKVLGDTSKAKLQVKKIGSKKLKKGKNYKFLVLAYKMKSGYKKVVATSNVIHAATTGGSYTDVKQIKPKETKKTLKKGKSWTIKATTVKKDSKKSVKKILGLRFESSNKSVAAVSAKGKVTAKKAGKATIYVYAQNGVRASVTVTVTAK